MDELMLDPAKAAPWLLRLPRRVPGPVASLECSATRAGGLMFSWKKPAGAVDGYRIERTRDGHEYEVIVETENKVHYLPPLPLNDGWFYRVTAFNARGQGAADWVFFYLRRTRDPMLQRVPVRPGLRVEICQLI